MLDVLGAVGVTEDYLQDIPIAPEVTKCSDHTPCPKGYLAWHEWAAEMKKTHAVEHCCECGLYMIWRPKPDALLKTDKGHQDHREGT